MGVHARSNALRVVVVTFEAPLGLLVIFLSSDYFLSPASASNQSQPSAHQVPSPPFPLLFNDCCSG